VFTGENCFQPFPAVVLAWYPKLTGDGEKFKGFLQKIFAVTLLCLMLFDFIYHLIFT